jgi:hypothetical protein
VPPAACCSVVSTTASPWCVKGRGKDARRRRRLASWLWPTAPAVRPSAWVPPSRCSHFLLMLLSGWVPTRPTNRAKLESTACVQLGWKFSCLRVCGTFFVTAPVFSISSTIVSR